MAIASVTCLLHNQLPVKLLIRLVHSKKITSISINKVIKWKKKNLVESVGMSSFQMTGSFIISFNKNVFVAHPVLIVHKSFKGHDDDPRGNEQQCSAQCSEGFISKIQKHS